MGHQRAFRAAILAGAAGILTLTDTGAALAQPVLEEIIITARKRAENLQEAPQAISAFTANDIKSAKIDDIADVAKLTTGLNFTALFGQAVNTPIIRGSAQTFGAPNVGVFVDGVYLTGKAAIDIDLADLERIEVVKGPQSALYGRNTFAGAINYVTKSPEFEPGGEVELTAGNYGTRKAQASVGGGLGDKVAVRVGASYRTFDGMYTSSIDGGEIDFEEIWGLSGDILLRATERFTLRGKISYTEEDSGQPASAIVRANGLPRVSGPLPPAGLPQTYVGELPAVGKRIPVNTTRTTPGELVEYGFRQDTLRASLNADYDLDGLTITSITAYSTRDNEYQLDGDNTVCDRASCPNFGPPIPGGRSTFATSSEDGTVEDWSQELRLTSDTGERFRYIVGAFYYDSESDAIQRSLAPLSPLPAFGYPRIISTTEAVAVFGSLAYDITPQLTATVEARQEWEDQTLRQFPTVTTGVPTTDASLRNLDLEQDFSFFTPRFILDYKATDDLLLYANVAKGTKTGGFNTNLRITADQITYGEESSWTYEAGAKLTWMDGRAITNIAVYRTDWKDQQVACQNPVTAGGTSTQRTYTCNVGEAEIAGLELDANVAVTDEVTLSGGYTYTDATYTAFVDDSLAATRANAGLTAPFDFDGKRLPYVPEHSLFGSLRFDMDLDSGWGVFARADVNWQSKQYIRADNLAFIDGRTVADLRAGVRYGNYTLTAYVDNVFDDDTAATAVRFFDSVNFSVPAPLVTGGERRQYGLILNARF